MWSLAIARQRLMPRPGARTVASVLLLMLVGLIILDMFRYKSGPRDDDTAGARHPDALAKATHPTDDAEHARTT